MEQECCPKFNPEPWDGTTRTWNNKLFLKDHVTSFLHIPLNYGAVMTRSLAKLDAAGANSSTKICLTDEKSLWGADVYLEAITDVQGAQMATISGEFLSKVFEGPFQKVGAWCKEMTAFVASKGKSTEKLYFYYTTCPKCAKKYGKNYVVLLAKVG